MTSVRSYYIPERNLIFGGQHEEKDPRLGLQYYGPYHYLSEKSSLEKIHLGLIGDKSTIEKVKEIIEMLGNPLNSYASNKWLYPPYCGMSKDTNFFCQLEISDTWQETLFENEMQNILQIVDTNERIGSAVELYLKKIGNIVGEDNPPNVILCGIPRCIEEHCGISEHTRGAKTPKPTKLQKKIVLFKKENQKFLDDWGAVVVVKDEEKPIGYDFRNSLKGKVMGLKPPVPIQLLRESTIDEILHYDATQRQQRQDPATFSWNLSTALYYKANGKPWRLAKLRDDTCYVGISFYKDKLSFNKDIQTSMAQVFTHSGEGFVLRGSEVYIDQELREPHLTEDQARDLLRDALKQYADKAKRNPARIVLHKSTLFSKSEQVGFNEIIENTQKDFVTITSRNEEIRFLRKGAYPVLRGTLISLTEHRHILYTSGYIPRIRTYPGHSIPSPLLIVHYGDSEIKEICNEILGLTKLNWNTTSFSTYLPITLEFSTEVGKILSELKKDAPLQNHYKFYM